MPPLISRWCGPVRTGFGLSDYRFTYGFPRCYHVRTSVGLLIPAAARMTALSEDRPEHAQAVAE